MRADASGEPSSAVLYTLSGPSVTGTTAQDVTFTAPPGAVLEANTTYWVTVAGTSSISLGVFDTLDAAVERVDSDWGLAGSALERTGSVWKNLRGFSQDSWLSLAVVAGVEVAERLESVDVPASTATYMSIREGQSAYGELGSASDEDWIKVEGLQNNRRYRLEVDFLGTDSIGGSFGLNSGYPGGAASYIGNLWGSNWSGNAVLDFSVRDAHVKSYWVEVIPADGMNVFLRSAGGRRIMRNGRGVLDPATVHVGGYVVTLRALDGVERMVGNLGQGYSDRFRYAVVGHRYSLGVDQGSSKFLGQYSDYAIDFRTGTHAEGYVLDSIEAQIQMGRTSLSSLGDVTVQISRTQLVEMSTEQLLVSEGDAAGSTYTVRLNVRPSEDVEVLIRPHSGDEFIDFGDTDLTVRPSTLTFTSDDWDTPQTVTVTADTDADSADDDHFLVHVPDGSGFLALSRLAVRVDDAQSSATASLPDAPIQSYRTEPRTRPLLAGERPTDATPVVSLWHPYGQGGGFDDKFGGSSGGGGDRRLCVLRGNAAYETANAALERQLSPTGGYFTDMLYAGGCAGVKLRPNARYWVVFENYYEIPRSSVFDADDFYYVAKARRRRRGPRRRRRMEHRQRPLLEVVDHCRGGPRISADGMRIGRTGRS